MCGTMSTTQSPNQVAAEDAASRQQTLQWREPYIQHVLPDDLLRIVTDALPRLQVIFDDDSERRAELVAEEVRFLVFSTSGF